MKKNDFKKWYENYQKTEKINNPSALYVCVEFAEMWYNPNARFDAWCECINFNYATSEQFNDVYNAYNHNSVDTFYISNWKWKQVKTSYRKYVKNKYGEKLWHFSSEDNICAASYLNHFNDKFNVPKFNKLHVDCGLSIHYSTMPF